MRSPATTRRTARTGPRSAPSRCLPSTVQAGLFTASPYENQESQNFGGGVNEIGGGPTQATAVIDHVSGLGGSWTGEYTGPADASGIGQYHQVGGRFTVTGSGDIAPIPAGH